MKKLPFQKYRPFPPIDLPRRQWPARCIQHAPVWCSVDLRDGNQALVDPMTVAQKITMLELLCKLNFKEIEIGFPAASDTELAFCRMLAGGQLLPADVRPQVLCQAREHLIRQTFDAIEGIPNVIFHLYNSTSALQRKVVFNASVEETTQLALNGVKIIKEEIRRRNITGMTLQYSPESFTGTELPVALAICNAVVSEWGATPDNKIILNLPATVEMATPNVYADMIEWMHTNLANRESIILSLHPHNDRGCAIAATELGLTAGADRVEGTLFGNGERTGNVDICTLALNMFSQGIDPHLFLSDINAVVDVYEECTGMTVHPRHPYAGELVYTAFSGSHQDAINKGFNAIKNQQTTHWEVPYLPIDPHDLNRTYEAIIRINSQSGKGGIAYIMETNYGFKLPRPFQMHFSRVVQEYTDRKQKEVEVAEIQKLFFETYTENDSPVKLSRYKLETYDDAGITRADCTFEVTIDNSMRKLDAGGNGPIDAYSNALKAYFELDYKITEFTENAIGSGSDASAVCYIELTETFLNQRFYGIGIHTNTATASLTALSRAVNELLKSHQER